MTMWNGWEDITDTKRAAKLDKMIYVCNCLSPLSSKNEQLLTKLLPTKVNKDEICIHCGYYALKMSAKALEIAKERGRFFNKIVKDRKND